VTLPTDWSSYDTIAARYDEVWGSRFEAVARLLWDHVPLQPKASVLDIGTGTGIVLEALGARLPEIRLAGCDRAVGMIQVARSRLPGARIVAADAANLPFRDGSFDVVTASFVLSHLPDYEAGLTEAYRALTADGIFAMTSWAADTDVHGKAWRELLAEVVSEDRVRAAVARVAPWEGLFETPAGVEGALSTAGFANREVHTLTVECRLPVEQFVADRELSSAGRFARHALGSSAWQSFLARAHDTLQQRFGSVLELPRRILIGIGHHKPAHGPRATPSR
jgi:ubiquinone/menaquinone biosynthesis C-methylase UbiE